MPVPASFLAAYLESAIASRHSEDDPRMSDLSLFVNLLQLVVKDRTQLALENIALRHQVAVYKRSVRRPNINLLVAIAIKLTSPGPVIFRQQRAGLNGRPFSFYKFRSMYLDAEERRLALENSNEQYGPIFKIKHDPRITPVGRVLRKMSIDELPQLWNVLKGDMTLVGPRPPTLNEVPEYERWQSRRLQLKGGLTCIWQVSGRSEIGFEDWMRMDLRHFQQRSFLFDAEILARTATAVLTGRGAY